VYGTHLFICSFVYLPVVPHKAVAEVSEEEAYRRAWLLQITDGRVNPLMV
jgi:hypothetical protein